MNETLLVEFMIHESNRLSLITELEKTAPEFLKTFGTIEASDVIIVYGKMNSEEASVIKLQNAFLSDHMRISYIPDDLKNKYRNR